jgi:hypothetical protein
VSGAPKGVLMGYTHHDKISGINGLYVGPKGSETLVVNSAAQVVSGVQTPLVASFLTSSAAQTVYVIAPYAGNITAAYCAADTANISAAYSVKHGSAGSVAASVTQSTAASVAGFVTTMTLGTVAVTAGESISVARGVQGTAGTSAVTLVITRTS